MKNERNWLIILALSIVAIIAYKLVRKEFEVENNAVENSSRVEIGNSSSTKNPVFKEKNIREVEDLKDSEKIIDEKLSGDMLLHFASKEEMEEFLKRANKNGIKIVKSLDELNIVRVRFETRQSKNDFLAKFNEVDFVSQNDPVAIPDPIVGAGSAGFRSHPLAFLGISDNKGWGEGVKVALIDSGVVEHPALKGKISYLDLIGTDIPISSFHGTAVASLIAGDSQLVKGISPGVELLSIRALNGDGSGDAFTVAEGILTAVKNGAQVINMSLGTSYDNPALREAILYAQRHGVILVAAVGNEGVSRVSYPANYPGVIAVSANDANENYLSFSNRGENVNISAPGIELTAAGLNNEVVLFTGTSASAPLVSGTVARMLQQNPNLNYWEILTALRASANEAGPPGEDVYFGEGILNVGRLENSRQKGIIDIAASNFYLQEVSGGREIKLFAIGENRGTEAVERIEMKISYPGFEKTYYFRNIASSQSFYETLTLNLGSAVISQGQEILMEIKGVSGDRVVTNDVKGVRIQLNNR